MLSLRKILLVQLLRVMHLLLLVQTIHLLRLALVESLCKVYVQTLVVVLTLVYGLCTWEVGGTLGVHLVEGVGAVGGLAHLEVADVELGVGLGLVALVEGVGVGLADAADAAFVSGVGELGGLEVEAGFLVEVLGVLSVLVDFGVVGVDGLGLDGVVVLVLDGEVDVEVGGGDDELLEELEEGVAVEVLDVEGAVGGAGDVGQDVFVGDAEGVLLEHLEEGLEHLLEVLVDDGVGELGRGDVDAQPRRSQQAEALWNRELVVRLRVVVHVPRGLHQVHERVVVPLQLQLYAPVHAQNQVLQLREPQVVVVQTERKFVPQVHRQLR